jgi:beta-glucosidase
VAVDDAWPEGFWWGTGASSTQCEGAAPASDWIDWEKSGRVPVSGNGNDFATRYAEDFGLYASLGLTHHRLSLDWARIEPEPGVRDPEVVAHYRDVLQAARDAGITPGACLHHFTLPRWVAASGGFADEVVRTGPWARHVAFVADTFGDLVAGWKPMNEANLYPLLGYRLGAIPPGHHDRDEEAAVLEQVLLANAEAAVRLRATGAPVMSIFGLATYEPADDADATAATVAGLYAAMWDPWLGLQRDGVLQVPGREPVERPDLAGAFDLIGFSYYFALGVRDGAIGLHPDGARTSPLGYGVWPDGVGRVLDRLHAELPGTPLVVAEFGIGTDDDTERAAYLQRGLAVVREALARGVDVRGFFHWTGVDNYEWSHGYDVKFGILTADRLVRSSAEVLREAALGYRALA